MLDFFLHFLIFNIIVSSKHTVHTTSQPVSNQSANNKQEHLISTRSVLSDTGDTIIVLSVKQRDAEKWKQMQSLFHWTAYSAKLQHKNKKPDHLINVFCLFCFLPVIHSFSFLLSFFLFYFFIYICFFYNFLDDVHTAEWGGLINVCTPLPFQCRNLTTQGNVASKTFS